VKKGGAGVLRRFDPWQIRGKKHSKECVSVRELAKVTRVPQGAFHPLSIGILCASEYFRAVL
jgi:hypothetical protein